MKLRLISIIMALFVVMTLIIPAGAKEILTDEGNHVGITDELYHEYSKIAEEVGHEYGLEITPCSAKEMTTKYSVEEYEAQIREFCVEMKELQEATREIAGNSTTNPSSPGFGTKILTVNTTRTIDNGTFGWTIRGKAVIGGTNPYYYSENVVIEELTCYLRPSNIYTVSNIGSSTQTYINSYTRKANQQVQIKKNGVAMTTKTISARFVLNTSTGVVTMTAA